MKVVPQQLQEAQRKHKEEMEHRRLEEQKRVRIAWKGLAPLQLSAKFFIDAFTLFRNKRHSASTRKRWSAGGWSRRRRYKFPLTLPHTAIHGWKTLQTSLVFFCIQRQEVLRKHNEEVERKRQEYEEQV